MITFGVLAGIMQYIGLIIILWFCLFIYGLIRRIRDNDSIPLDIAFGLVAMVLGDMYYGSKGFVIALIGTILALAVDKYTEGKKKE